MQAREEVIFIKGKRSKRPIIRAASASPLSVAMADTSSSTTVGSTATGLSGGGGVIVTDLSGGCDRATVDQSSSPPSDSGDDDRLTRRRDEEEEYMANCLMLLAGGRTQKPPQAAVVAAEVYQCKTCSKSFSSFQALGGHRASHKRPIKPPTLDQEIKKPPLKHRHQEISSPSNRCGGDDSSIILSLQIPSRSSSFSGNKTTRVHECSICGAEFASGQALGGHMRRHRPIPTVTAASDRSHGGGGESREVMKRPRNLLSLDLNLPAPEDHDHRDSKFPFASKEQVIVFSTSPMVDCHH